MLETLSQQIYDLIVQTSTNIPEDVEQALSDAAKKEHDAGNSIAASQLNLMLENIKLARNMTRPLCQDTGLINFYVEVPASLNKSDFVAAAEKAIIKATDEGILRKNSVCSISGKNSGTNLGVGTPAFYWEESDDENIRVKLLLKGGGSENVGSQYALPDIAINAERDLDGVRKCILDAVHKAQGKGCPPSILSVTIGGDRASGYSVAKKGFFRKMGERSDNPELADFEKKVLNEINNSGIGTMGLGGGITSLDLFVTALNRHPASFFVTIAQMCWSCRRGECEIKR